MSTAATEHPNATRMRAVVEAVASGDVPGALQHFPDDVVWFTPVGGGAEGAYRGRDGLQRFFGRLAERSSGTWRPEVDDVLASDEHVVIFLRIIARRNGDELDATVAHFATVEANGFARNWFLPDNVAAWNRFFG